MRGFKNFKASDARRPSIHFLFYVIVVRALHQHRKGIFLFSVPALNFDMGIVSTRDRTKTRYPTEIILHRVKCNKILIN